MHPPSRKSAIAAVHSASFPPDKIPGWFPAYHSWQAEKESKESLSLERIRAFRVIFQSAKRGAEQGRPDDWQADPAGIEPASLGPKPRRMSSTPWIRPSHWYHKILSIFRASIVRDDTLFRGNSEKAGRSEPERRSCHHALRE